MLKTWTLILILWSNPGPVALPGYESATECETAVAFFKNGRAGDYYKSHSCIPGPIKHG